MGAVIKSVFITGGSGFIAPHLLRALDPSCTVTLHVRDAAKSASMATSFPGVHVISGPLTESGLAAKIPDDCETVVHLAGAVHGPSVEAVLDSNVTTTRNVLRIMERRHIPRLIFMSTAAVWSDTEGVRLSESMEPNPQTLYGYAKLSAERLIADSLAQGQISSAVVLRCNNTYGPGGFQGAVASFVQRLRRDLPVQIEGDGLQMREPLHVSDTVDVIKKSFAGRPGMNVYSISGPEVVTVLAMAETIAKVLGRKLEIEWKPQNPDRARHIIMNIEKARRELGWVPHTGFEEGCRRYVAAL
ncbi:NAD(P)-dependent oxidoreductase [Bradyrhizobium sediminis]|uniref:NAD(P)-dependent oxidoreductase n=1 Tax=Bradyrhizobium sediminis TaxID=2840469 RepID=A0A975NKY7_9BRAD|nr:NAD(P)-dependent oxidoreductase [Bradyrhizobium sediminis]